jgi:hypothetical protein
MLIVLAAARLVAHAAGLPARLTAAIRLLAALLLTLPAVLPALAALLLVGIAAPLAFVARALVALGHAVGIALRGVAVRHGYLLFSGADWHRMIQGRAMQIIDLSVFGAVQR